MEINKEFKETEAGQIPIDWEVKRLGEVLSKRPEYGINAPSVPFNDNLPAYLRITDISEDGKYITSNKVSVDDISSSLYFLETGDIVVARTGASVGKTYLYNKSDGRLVFAGFLIRLRTDPNLLLSEFLKYYTRTNRYWNWVVSTSMRSGQPGLNGNELASFNIAFPLSLFEQAAITTTLNDIDSLTNSIEKLIAKKRNIKQGAMQQLLRSKKGWLVKKLGEIGTVIRGASPRPQGDKRYYGGNIPRLMVEDVTRDGKFVTPKVDFLTEEGAKRSRPCKAGTLTIVCSGTVGIPSILAVDACIHDGFLALIGINKNYSTDFLYHKLTTLRSQFDNSATHGGIFTNLTTSSIKEFEIAFPSTKEQIYIATILSDIDAEIAALEARLEKYKYIKQGMMQNLLTGKIRLI